MNTSRNVVVTGASGFVGRALLAELAIRGFDPVGIYRSKPATGTPETKTYVVGDIDDRTDWTEALAGADAVVHCAARVHVMNDTSADPLAEFRKVNVDATRNLALQAIEAGIKRFVFISSIKVNGETTDGRSAFTASDSPEPSDPYGQSKFEAEAVLRQLADEHGLQVTIIRPVLVYGPGVRANFRNIATLVAKGVPLPLGAIHNKRSLVALDNLVDLIITCIQHPRAPGETFLVSDGRDLSTSELLFEMGQAMNKPARLIPVPSSLIKWGGMVLRRESIVQRLCGSLRVDISHTCNTLGWEPPLTVAEGLQRFAAQMSGGEA